MWPFRRHAKAEVAQALAASAERLNEVKATEARLEPKLAELEEIAGHNHIADAVRRTFRVAR